MILLPDSIIGMLHIKDALKDWIPNNEFVRNEFMKALEERKKLEDKLDELIKEQSSCTAKFFDLGLSKQIKNLEWIRGRRYIKCNKCNADLTLTTCPHHNKKRDGTIK